MTKVFRSVRVASATLERLRRTRATQLCYLYLPFLCHVLHLKTLVWVGLHDNLVFPEHNAKVQTKEI